MYDQHGREINYLRLSVTGRCNLSCFYCMPDADSKPCGGTDLLTHEEMCRLCEMFAVYGGIKKIRLTGGEPLVKDDTTDLIRFLNKSLL